jgi:hypothetical protein
MRRSIGMVSAVVVGQEQIGPHRYIATLGVIFDRTRTSGYLGMQGPVAHSAPMLVVPDADRRRGHFPCSRRARPGRRPGPSFRTGSSVIDYVRPNGAGADFAAADSSGRSAAAAATGGGSCSIRSALQT